MRFGLDGKSGKTLEETGQLMNLTREGVRQIQIKALSKLRRMLKDELEPAMVMAC